MARAPDWLKPVFQKRQASGSAQIVRWMLDRWQNGSDCCRFARRRSGALRIRA